MTAPIVEARKLGRWYGQVVAATDIDLVVPRGVVGLLGPNGAGKSTLLKLITGQVRPSAGTVRVFGADPVREPEVFHRIGFCSEDDVLFEDLTPGETLRFLGRLRGYDPAEAARRATRALDRCGIGHAADRKSGGFSKGMRQRTRIAAAILHEPELLLLDEPMTGLDPVGRRAMVDLVKSWGSEGRTVLFSSHILHEVESISEYMVVLAKGMVLAEGSPQHLRTCLADYAFTLEIEGADLRELARVLIMRSDVAGLEFSDATHLRVSTLAARAFVRELPAILLAAGTRVESISAPEENLEALFQRLVR